MKKLIIGSAAYAFPLLAFAQLGNLINIAQSIGTLVDTLLPIVVAVALLAFFWGLATFIFAAGNEDAKDRGKRIMIWGIIALFVMVSIWGLVEFIQQALGVGGQTDVPGGVPRVQP